MLQRQRVIGICLLLLQTTPFQCHFWVRRHCNFLTPNAAASIDLLVTDAKAKSVCATATITSTGASRPASPSGTASATAASLLRRQQLRYRASQNRGTRMSAPRWTRHATRRNSCSRLALFLNLPNSLPAYASRLFCPLNTLVDSSATHLVF